MTTVKPWKDWKDGGFEKSWKAEVARVDRVKAAEAAEAAEAAAMPELITDPVTGEQREAPVEPVTAKAPARAWRVKKHLKLDQDVAAMVEAQKAETAARREASERRSEKARAERAKSAALLKEAQRAVAAQRPPRPVDEPFVETAGPTALALRAAVAEGQLGRLGVGAASLSWLLDEFAERGHYARPGRAASAATLLVDREGPRLGLVRQQAGKRDEYVRLQPGPGATNLDESVAFKWLKGQIITIRSQQVVGKYTQILIAVMPDCIPANTEPLAELAAWAAPCAVALINHDDGPSGWEAV